MKNIALVHDKNGADSRPQSAKALRTFNSIPSFDHRMPLLVMFAVMLVYFGILLLPADRIEIIVAESGFMENAQFLGYIACAIISWIYAKKGLWLSGLSGGAIFAVFALRELDFQKRFTEMSVTKTSFFINPEITLTVKLVSSAVLVSILILIFFFAKKNYKKLFDSIGSAETWAYTSSIGIALLPISVVLDSLHRWLKDFGIIITEFQHLMIKLSEEMVELLIPLFFLMALLQWKKEAPRSETKNH